MENINKKVILARIYSGKNKLSDFYAYDAFDIIEEDVTQLSKGKNISYQIKHLDLLEIAIELLQEKKLDQNEINNLVLFINSNVTDISLMDVEYIDAVNEILSSLKADISKLSRLIKCIKMKDQLPEQEEKLISKKERVISSQKELITSKKYIKITYEKIQEVRKNMSLKDTKKAKNKKAYLTPIKKDKKQKNSVREMTPYHDMCRKKILEFAELIDKDTLSREEIIQYAEEIMSLNINDNVLKFEVKYLLSKLNFKLKIIDSGITKTKKDVKTIDRRIEEIREYQNIDENLKGEYKRKKNHLKESYSVLKKIKKNYVISDQSFRRIIKSEMIETYAANDYDATASIVRENFKKVFYDSALDGEVLSGLTTKNEEQEMMMLSESIAPYYQVSDYKEAFIIKPGIGEYAVSIDNVYGKTIVRIHANDLDESLSDISRQFLTNYYVKQISKTLTREDMLEYKLYYNNYLFKESTTKPTIAYELIFDEDYKLESFDIKKMDVKVREASRDEKNILDKIFAKNKTMEYHNINQLLIGTVTNEYMKYAQENKIPMIYFGSVVDEYEGNYKKTLKKCCEKMGDKLEEFSSLLLNCSRNTFNSVCYKWYKNFKKRHFELEYHDDYQYHTHDFALTNPFSFMGINNQYLVRKYVLNKDTSKKEKDNISKRQKEIIKILNGKIKYLDMDYFISLVGTKQK